MHRRLTVSLERSRAASSLALLSPASCPPASALDVKRPEVRAFIDEMSRDHGFDARAARDAAASRRRPSRRSSMRSAGRPSASCRGTSIASASSPRSASMQGADFWIAHGETLERIGDAERRRDASSAFSASRLRSAASPGAIACIDALATLAFDYPPRARVLSRRAAAVPAAVARGGRRSADRARLVRRRDGRAAVHLLQLSQLRGRWRRRRQARSVEQLGRRDRLGRELPASRTAGARRAGRRHRLAAEATISAASTPSKLELNETVQSLRDKGVRFETSLPPMRRRC